jgi:hypothetical protein
MTLVLTVIAAIITTIIWYKNSQSKMMIGTLSLMYWGASIMWLIDAIFEYAEMGAEEFFNQPMSSVLNDMLLGICVVVLGLLIWLVILLIKDPAGRIYKNKK